MKYCALYIRNDKGDNTEQRVALELRAARLGYEVFYTYEDRFAGEDSSYAALDELLNNLREWGALVPFSLLIVTSAGRLIKGNPTMVQQYQQLYDLMHLLNDCGVELHCMFTINNVPTGWSKRKSTNHKDRYTK